LCCVKNKTTMHSVDMLFVIMLSVLKLKQALSLVVLMYMMEQVPWNKSSYQ
jgi:hypothetical protein